MRFTFIIIIILFASCNKPECKNNNPTFDKYVPEAPEYKTELVKQIDNIGKDNIKYWIIGYSEKEGKEFMTIWMQNGSLCAKATLDITGNETDLSQYRKVKGASYSGAELSGLHYTIKKDSTGYNFVFDAVDNIID